MSYNLTVSVVVASIYNMMRDEMMSFIMLSYALICPTLDRINLLFDNFSLDGFRI